MCGELSGETAVHLIQRVSDSSDVSAQDVYNGEMPSSAPWGGASTEAVHAHVLAVRLASESKIEKIERFGVRGTT